MSKMNTTDIQDTDLANTRGIFSVQTYEDMFVKKDEKKLLIRRDLVVMMSDQTARWIVQTGQDNGKLVEKITVFKEGKQKRNAFEQAISECESKRKLKYKKDKYREGRENAVHPDDVELPPPMLATPKEKSNIVYPCLGQRKLDGNRCLTKVTFDDDLNVTSLVMWSRQGNLFTGLTRIEDRLKEIVNSIPKVDHPLASLIKTQFKEIIFDGELFTLEYPFPELNGVLKLDDIDPNVQEPGSKQHKKALEVINKKAKMQYWLYDIALKNSPQHARTTFLESLLVAANVPEGSISSKAEDDPVVLEPAIVLNSPKDLDEFHSSNVGQGFEGTIVRIQEGGYLFKKRSKDLIKVKDFHDEEFECVGMKENSGLPGTGVFVCVTQEGNEFDAMPEGSMQERLELFKNKDSYTNKKLNVKFFEKYPETGIPRFPVARIRDEK
jgi:ATP-dependent DNA ligase